jgi:hypothetical protein
MGAVLDYCRFPVLCRETRACVFRSADAPVRTSAIDLPSGAAGKNARAFLGARALAKPDPAGAEALPYAGARWSI